MPPEGREAEEVVFAQGVEQDAARHMARAGLRDIVHPGQQAAGFLGDLIADLAEFPRCERLRGHDHVIAAYGIPAGVGAIRQEQRGRFDPVVRQEAGKPALGVHQRQRDIRLVFEPHNDGPPAGKVRPDDQADVL